MKTNAHRTIGQITITRFALLMLASNLLIGTAHHGFALCDGLGGSGGDCSGGNGIYYETNNGFATVTGIIGLVGQHVTIPGTLGGLPVITIAASAFAHSGIAGVTIPNTVTNIGDSAFSSCTILTNVTMGSGVTRIGQLAFSGCTSLTNIIIPEGLTSIGDNAFNYCLTLATITIPNSVTSIGDGAFSQNSSLANVTIGRGVTHIGNRAFFFCQNLTAITVDSLNPSYSSVNGVLFDKEQTTLVQFPGGKSGGFTVPNSVTNIVAGACYGNTKLTSVNLSTNLASMGDGAFAACSLTNITIPNSVTSIGLGTFQYCISLTRAVIGNGVASIRNETFLSCVNLKSVTIGTNVTSIGDNAFSGCYNLTNVTIPNGVIGVGERAFATCESLTRVVFPPSLESIGNGAFDYCVNLTNVTISEGLRSIGDGAFNSCGLKTVALPGSVTNIGLTAFRYCSLLTAITVSPLNPAYASSNGVLFNKGRTVLIQYPTARAGSYAIPNTVTNIGPFSFAGASLLTNVTIPSGVTHIEHAAFAGVGLTSLSLPDSIGTIGDSAFASCTSLTTVYFQGNAPILSGLYLFSAADNVTVYYLPGTIGWGPTFGERPTAPWLLPTPLILTRSASFGVRTNAFGFIISWAANIPVVVEACTNLGAPVWTPLTTNSLAPSGWFQFSDPQWTNYPSRIYRVRSQ